MSAPDGIAGVAESALKAATLLDTDGGAATTATVRREVIIATFMIV